MSLSDEWSLTGSRTINGTVIGAECELEDFAVRFDDAMAVSAGGRSGSRGQFFLPTVVLEASAGKYLEGSRISIHSSPNQSAAGCSFKDPMLPYESR